MSTPAYRHKKPDYQILIDGEDISARIKPRLNSLTLIDKRGFEADTVDVTLEDTDGLLALPRRGAQMQILIGWTNEGLVDKGLYTIDEVEHSGTPDQMTIRGKSADVHSEFQKLREESWHNQPLLTILETIAQRNDLELVADAELSSDPIEHLDQQNESDAALLTRLAQDYDAFATVKQRKLLFMSAAQAKTVSGEPLPKLTITRKSGDSHRFSIADRNAYTGVVAYWHDEKSGERKTVEVDGEEKGDREFLAGEAGNVKTLRHVYANARNAQRAAQSAWEKIQRGVASFSITLAEGQPSAFPEMPVEVIGWKPEIDQAEWIITQIDHSLSDSGLVSTLQLEVNAAELGE